MKDCWYSKTERSFTKGENYHGNQCNVIENLTVTNDQGERHRIGNWAKNFKNVSPGYVKNK
jgi:hypothetical protein